MTPVLIAALYRRVDRRVEPVAPRADLATAANYLYMIDGEVPDPATGPCASSST